MNRESFNHPFEPLEREFHISREARDRYHVDQALVSLRGTAMIADFGAAQQLAVAMNAARDVRRIPESAVRAGELYAAALLDEILHLVIQVYRERVDPGVVARAESALRQNLGEDAVDEVLEQFVQRFPTVAVAREDVSPTEYLAAETEGTANREIALEELLMLHLANANPALERFADLFDETPLEDATEYRRVVDGIREHFAGRPGLGAGEGAADGAAATDAGRESLLDLLEAPSKASPTSLQGQLEFVRKRWGSFLGPRFEVLLERIVRTLDVIKEESKAGGFGGAGPSIVLDAGSLRGRGREEYEAFSADESWMPRVVMLAKSSYVWLDQLSKRYQRDIVRLDQIPDEVLDELADRGFSGLWLIGLWERSEASKRIKHLRGQKDAVASAYALFDYQIAGDLGGDAAYASLRDRAWQRGIRLASDMVPNHVGVDGKWVMEHPDWFVQAPEAPYPAYTFNGPDLSADSRAAIYLEDHYYDSSDAAVVFKRVDRDTGQERFLYHGNDGTTMPWNDTAQLDYLNPEVREAVIQTILHVARKFPIIRFDAAMTLAKQHIQRLWYPEPGSGGAIPSRSRYGSMSADEFEQRIPKEFWREVVDRVAEEVPGTLLLAEAFWMMEGYFVRTLGMHRVYNSAFMNMLKREENDKYRQLIKNTLEFDPEILKRFVNFMNNPDEETAVAQFGRDDKYFGTTILMSTMPGLPMYGHGQVEGRTEKYGMEYRRAMLDESPDQALIDRHRREVFPLLHRREQFAHVENFRLYDVRNEHGVVEDVYAYSNRHRGRTSLVFYNNRFDHASGWIRESAPYAIKSGSGKEMHTESLASALALEGGDDRYLILRGHVAGTERLKKSDDLRDQGLHVELGAFKYQVFMDLREVVDVDGTYGELHRSLDGAAVPSIDEARRDLQLADVHAAFRVLLSLPATDADSSSAEGGATEGAAAESSAGEGPGSETRAAKSPAVKTPAVKGRDASTGAPATEQQPEAQADAAARDAFEAFVTAASAHTVLAKLPRAEDRYVEGVRRLASSPMETVVDGAAEMLAQVPAQAPAQVLAAVAVVEPFARSADLARELRLDRALARELEHAEGFGGDEAWVHGNLFVALASISTEIAVGSMHADRILERFSGTDEGRIALAVNWHDGIPWFNRERYRAVSAALGAAASWIRPDEADEVERFVEQLAVLEEESGYRLDRLVGAVRTEPVDVGPDGLGEASPLENGAATTTSTETRTTSED